MKDDVRFILLTLSMFVSRSLLHPKKTIIFMFA
uniref:Uncharacterized protein n=1 Tax=Rhizophora mucronata TaxID=61149 RepID=A0A2P2PS04_RHIMU